MGSTQVLDQLLEARPPTTPPRLGGLPATHSLSSHLSAEAAHRKLLDALGLDPLLSLGMRLGEGSGAALAIAILQGAVACHTGMATFAEAGVSDG